MFYRASLVDEIKGIAVFDEGDVAKAYNFQCGAMDMDDFSNQLLGDLNQVFSAVAKTKNNDTKKKYFEAFEACYPPQVIGKIKNYLSQKESYLAKENQVSNASLEDLNAAGKLAVIENLQNGHFVMDGNGSAIGSMPYKIESCASNFSDFDKGQSNSIIFKAKSQQEHSPKIIRLSRPHESVTVLPAKLRDDIGSLISSSFGTELIEKDNTVYQFEVAPFYANGSLFDVLELENEKKAPELDVSDSFMDEAALQARGKVCLDFSIMMAKGFKDIQKAGYFFPDAKVSNWLVNDDGKLVIHDTKSILPTENGICRQGDLKKEFRDLVYSEGYRPPEDNETQVDVDSAHAYMLGINLYQMLTKESVLALRKSREHSFDDLEEMAKDIPDGMLPNFEENLEKQTQDLLDRKMPLTFDFQHPVFFGMAGQEYQVLIENLINENPEDRMSINDTIKQLQLIQRIQHIETSPHFNQQQKEDVCDLLTEYEAQMKGHQQVDTSAFLQKKMDDVENSQDKNKAIKDLSAEIGILKAINKLTNDLENSSKYSVGKRNKAKQIKIALGNVIKNDKVGDLLNVDANDKDVQLLMKALDKKRINIFQKKETETFRDFKAQLQSVKEQAKKQQKSLNQTENSKENDDDNVIGSPSRLQ